MKWHPQFFGSGTCIVKSDVPAYPHYYVYGNKDDNPISRHEATKQLAQWLNGDIERPEWMDVKSMILEDGNESIKFKYGHTICVVGPMVDIDPPNLNWVTDDSEYSQRMRKNLIDTLCFGVKVADNDHS